MLKFALILITVLSLHAGENEEIAKISEAMGHLIGKNLQALGLPLDIDALAKGMQDEADGKASPLADEEYERGIATLQEESHDKAAVKNLTEANEFLQKNETLEGIVTVEKGKLQYKVLKEGEGEVVQPYNNPLIRYQSRALSGDFLQGDFEEELISLDEALLGLKLGITGMKEGESRILYIHPEMGYGKESYAPNSLLIFEVEVIKAGAPPATSLIETPPAQ